MPVNPAAFFAMYRKGLIDSGKTLLVKIGGVEFYGSKGNIFFVNKGFAFSYGSLIYRLADFEDGAYVVDLDDTSVKPLCTNQEFALASAYSGEDIDMLTGWPDEEEESGPNKRRAYFQSNMQDCQDLVKDSNA